jgi:aminocarboxymuconate-semialdehyde decarboxylase
MDSLVHDAKALQFVLEVMGEDSICLGSDYPFPLGEKHPGSLIESMYTNLEIKEKLLYKNALKWLGSASGALFS